MADRSPGGGSARIGPPASCCYHIGQAGGQARREAWLTRSELGALAGSQLTVRSVEQFLDGEDPPKLRWRAEFGRS